MRLFSQGLIIVGFVAINWSSSLPADDPHALRSGAVFGSDDAGFRVTANVDSLQIALDGRDIMTFVFRHAIVKRPFFAHVRTPGGIQVSRRFPPVAGEDPTDHADMHPGVWLAFGKLSGSDFWRNVGRVVHQGFVGEPRTGDSVRFETVDHYVNTAGTTVCRQRTVYEVQRIPAGYVMSLAATFSSDAPIVFGVQEEMGFGIRVDSRIRAKGGNGSIRSSHGGTNEKGTWGLNANWWDYAGEIDKRFVGMMVMSAPENPPTWSHSRDYGFLAANPFAVDRPENRNKSFTVPVGATFHLRFGLAVHETTTAAEFDCDATYRRFASPQP